jgi:uncharacterized protein DUF397
MSIVIHSELQWRKSSYSSAQGGECVEVAGLSERIAIRDSKNPDGPLLTIDTLTFAKFLKTIKRTSEHF